MDQRVDCFALLFKVVARKQWPSLGFARFDVGNFSDVGLEILIFAFK